MIITVHTDGGSRGNPGPSAIGFIIERDGKIIQKGGKFIGVATNNAAEYSAVIAAYEALLSLSFPFKKGDNVVFFLDSELVVSQLNGLYKIKQRPLQEFHDHIRTLESLITVPALYTHIPRESNSEADSLVNYYLDTRSLK